MSVHASVVDSTGGGTSLEEGRVVMCKASGYGDDRRRGCRSLGGIPFDEIREGSLCFALLNKDAHCFAAGRDVKVEKDPEKASRHGRQGLICECPLQVNFGEHHLSIQAPWKNYFKPSVSSDDIGAQAHR